jgi:uncharacterized protein YdeI (YjbR/CyaY-like superfamily)
MLQPSEPRATVATSMKPTFFTAPAELREWLAQHHDKRDELWVGFHKKSSGRPSITWPEAVDQALCFGWIDGVRKSVDEDRYTIRFTPRKARSTWSAVNIKRAEELTRQGLMHPAGVEAFKRRTQDRSGIYSYEQRRAAKLGKDFEQRFRANEKAWEFFQAQPPSYRTTAIWWVVSAKKEETRRKRLLTLIQDSQEGHRIPPLTGPPRPR